MAENKKSVLSITNSIVNELSSQLQISSTKATLADLRNTVGKPLLQSVHVWSFVFQYLPEEFIGNGERITSEEKAIISALQLYATHQQGKSEAVHLQKQEGKWSNIGYSLSALHNSKDQVASDRRFNALITSSTFEELVHHLRQLIKLLKSKSDMKINYARLAEDIYWFDRGFQDKVRLNWARAYYGTKVQGDEKDEK